MLIGLTGNKGAGKDTFAHRLISNHGFRKLSFAQPLKDMLRVLGLSRDEIDGSMKEMPCALLGGATPRHAMQTLGTEWGRRLIHDEIWLTAWRRNYDQLIGKDVVVTDVRFDNEAKLIRSLGGKIIEIIRESKFRDTHASEQGVNPEYVNFIVDNTGTIADLRKKADQISAWSQI